MKKGKIKFLIYVYINLIIKTIKSIIVQRTKKKSLNVINSIYERKN